MQPSGTCHACGANLPQQNYRGRPVKWCSQACRLRVYRAKNPGWYKYQPKAPTEKQCTVCGVRFTVLGIQTRCEECLAKAAKTIAFCPVCSEVFRAAEGQECCSRTCSGLLTAERRGLGRGVPLGKGHQARAARFGVKYERIDRTAVFERDAWVCGLCDTGVDPDLQWPDPMSASLDHVTPLSRGGDHVWSNVQLAHLRCNVDKGNKEVAGHGGSRPSSEG